jgi:excisionase family DNA binding protein
METQGEGRERSGPPATAALDALQTLTVEEVAEVLGVNQETVRRYVREGQLRAARWGRRHHIRPEAIREFQEARTFSAPDPAEWIRRARSGKARARTARAPRRGGSVTAPSRPGVGAPQAGGEPPPAPGRPGGSALPDRPAAVVR